MNRSDAPSRIGATRESGEIPVIHCQTISADFYLKNDLKRGMGRSAPVRPAMTERKMICSEWGERVPRQTKYASRRDAGISRDALRPVLLDLC